MNTHVNFTYEWEGNNLPNGIAVDESVMLDVEATVTPFIPTMQPSLSNPGAPAEGGEVEGLTISFDNEPWPLDHPTYHNKWNAEKDKMDHNVLVPLQEAIMDHIYDNARVQQDWDEYNKGYDG